MPDSTNQPVLHGFLLCVGFVVTLSSLPLLIESVNYYKPWATSLEWIGEANERKGRFGFPPAAESWALQAPLSHPALSPESLALALLLSWSPGRAVAILVATVSRGQILPPAVLWLVQRGRHVVVLVRHRGGRRAPVFLPGICAQLQIQ